MNVQGLQSLKDRGNHCSCVDLLTLRPPLEKGGLTFYAERKMKQKGRSMIEMLGVLAIIGVMSIGGIALYRRAVNNHQANTILDDVNRFAFVIMESNRAFSTNAFIDNVEYSQTSTHNLDAFLGASSGQFGIVVTDVPKGVCEPLVDKAVIEYKVRVLPANTAESVVQISASGIVYDSFH